MTDATDPDVAAGRALFDQYSNSNQSPASPPPPEDPDVAAGRSLFQQYSQPDTTASTTAVPQTVWDQIKAGGIRALHDVTDLPAELVAKGADAIGLTAALNKYGIAAPDAATTTNADRDALETYNDQYGDSPIAGTARVAGQIGLTVPALMAGGAIGGAIARPIIGDAVTDFLAGKAGTSLLTRGTSLAANGALQGGAAGAMTAGQDPSQSVGSQALTGATAGAVIGPVAGALGSVGGKAVGAITGYGGGLSPEDAALAQAARDKYNIPLTAPQLSDNSAVKIMSDQSSKLLGAGGGDLDDAQRAAYNTAVARTFGEPVAGKITPTAMTSAAARIGQTLDDIASRTTVNADPKFVQDLAQIETDAGQAPLGSGGLSAIKNQLDNVLTAAANGNGSMSGDVYQQLTKSGAPLDRAMNAGDPNVQFYAGRIHDALEDAFQRSASPEDQDALATAREQWRNMKTVEPLAAESTDGNISPAKLMARVLTSSRRFDGSTSGVAYTGGGDLGELARIGQRFMKAPPQSGTADRALVNGLMFGGFGGLGYLVHPLAAAGAIPALTANRLLGGYLRSNGLAGRVINSSLAPVSGAVSGVSPLVGAVAPTIGNGADAARNWLFNPQ